jgi:hypothetical protein
MLLQVAGRDNPRNGVTLTFKDELDLDIILATGGIAQGTVTNAGGSPAVDAVIVLIPERHEESHLYRSARSNERGSFEVFAAPGNYTVFAWSEIEGAAYRDPAFMQKYQSEGRTVVIERGNRVTTDLKLLN